MLPAILFDFDGTLVDSIELILTSARFAFEGFDGRVPNDDEWRTGIGRPLVDAFRDFVDDEAEVARLVTRYREFQMVHHDRLLRANPRCSASAISPTCASSASPSATHESDA